MLKMTCFHDSPKFDRTLLGDEYMTRKSAWADIMPYIPDEYKNGNKRIWEPFKGNGQSGRFLKELGFDVYMRDKDFFDVSVRKTQKKKLSLIITNPPFTKKADVLKRLKILGIPFILLVPTTVLHTSYFKELFEDDTDIQLIIPFKKRQFDKVDLQKQKNRCSFYTLYVCWRVGLTKPIFFI